ncbi:fibronectin type III domain-containing protein [bacterium]|nr:fibronectin type III domain-containing protein [bacterium]
MKHSPWLVILVATPLLAQAAQKPPAAPRLDARMLAPDRNQLSNPSFEAPTTDLPPSYGVLANGECFSVSRDVALHGQASLRVRVPATTTGAAVLAQRAPGCGRCTYELSGWVRPDASGGGVTLALEALGERDRPLARQVTDPAAATGEGWRPLAVRLQAPAETELVRVSVEGAPGAVACVDALRLAIVAGPRRRSYGPHVTDLHVTRTEAAWATIQWTGPAGAYEVSYRHQNWPRNRRVTLDGIPGFVYSLVGLQADAPYQVRVRPMWPEHYDEAGHVVPAPVTPTPPEPLVFTTKPWQYREAGPLRIWPMAPVPAPGNVGHNPRLGAAQGHLYLAQESDGGVALLKIAPEPLKVVWSKQVVPPPTDGPAPVLRDLHVEGESLDLLVQRGPQEVALLRLGLDGEQVAPETVLPLCAAPARIAQAGLAVFRDGLWVVWVESTADDPTHGLLRLGLLAEGGLTKTFAWDKAPVAYPGDASAAGYGDELRIAFCDAPSASGFQPLRLVSFNGLDFGSLRKLRDMGCNRQPRARQFGPALHVAYASDVNYLGQRGRYCDLMLTTLLPGTLELETVTVVDDRKYNCSPGLSVLGESLWLVHEKLESAPTAETPRPRSYGVFIGRADFGPPPRTAPRPPRRGTGPSVLSPLPASPPPSN